MFKIASSRSSHSQQVNSSRGSSNWIILGIVAVLGLAAGLFISLKSSPDMPLSPSMAVAEVAQTTSNTSKCPITGAIRSLIGGSPHHSTDEASSEVVAETTTDEIHSVRVATLLPFAADQLLAMGIEPVCVPGLRGVTPESWNGIATVQLDHSAGPNLEQLIAVEPDFIVTGSTYAQFMPHIASVTDAEIVMMDIESIDSVFDHINTLGEICSRPQESRQIIVDIKSRLMPAASETRGEPVKVLAIFGTPHSFFAFMPDTYLGDLIAHSGGQIGPEGLVSHKVYKGLAPLSMETVVDFNPDLLLVLFHGPEDTSRAMFEGDPLWSSLTAVNEDRMFFLADDIYAMRPGSQMDLAMTQVNGYIKDVEQRLQ
ncbi:MAG: ABC transporter substrate-binding protein [Phycisphaerales bacterium]|nr:ABC transporter substrate-binding protein [Phycisphaerales bacterium]